MKVLPIKIKLLSPLFNYSKVTNGGAITSDFIGDMALTYALNRVRKDKPFAENFFQRTARSPNYAELRELDYYFTVAKPIRFEMTGLYIRNTLYNTDNYPHADLIGNDGAARKSLFKNFFKVQGIRPESEFSACILCRDSFKPQLPFVIRVGTGRECLALLERDKSFDEAKEEVWLNAFALKWIFGNLPVAIKRLTEDGRLFFEYKLENYMLMKRVSIEQVKFIFGEAFND
jgi:CRISPR-associated protein Csc1